MLNYLKERYHERNKLLLGLNVLFGLLTLYFAVRLLIVVTPSQSIENTTPLVAGMTLSLGLAYAVRVIEKYVTGKRKNIGILLTGTIIILTLSIFELSYL